MKALLIIAHGSRRQESNDEIGNLAQLLAPRVRNVYSSTHHAFLELAKPTISEAIDLCVNDGAREIVVIPYFLAAGRHVAEDIPAQINSKKIEYPSLKFTITPYLGASSEIVAVLQTLSNY